MKSHSCFLTVALLFGLASGVPAAEPSWIPLFDGKTLTGWKASENPTTFRVEDGTIVAHGPRAHLFYVGTGTAPMFRNFELKAQVKAGPGANSGIYFHTAFQDSGWPDKGFEVQVNNSAQRHGDYHERKKTGSLYGVRNVYKQLAPDDTWFTMYITVRANRIQIRVNDLLVVDYVEPATGTGRRLGRGTFALQGHDPESRVSFRDLQVRPLPDHLEPTPAPAASDLEEQILALGADNYPLIDFHTHLKGGLTIEQVLQDSLRTGFSHGVAVNCGLGFSVTNDAGIDAFLQQMRGQPVFIGMQAEGREWTRLFSPQAIARFDYVFTDGMTIMDPQGKRSRLWIPEEVQITDKQQFMDNLVNTIVKILETEPIDIYANPTYLPEVLAADYDTLWTAEPKTRVIEAAAKRGIAIEISSRLRLPKADFIKQAKRAGIKFTLGTNNADRQIHRNGYGLAMIKECGLGWQDLWVPTRPTLR